MLSQKFKSCYIICFTFACVFFIGSIVVGISLPFAFGDITLFGLLVGGFFALIGKLYKNQYDKHIKLEKESRNLSSEDAPNTNIIETLNIDGLEVEVSFGFPEIPGQQENESLHDYHRRKLSEVDLTTLMENDLDIDLSNKEILFLRYMNKRSDSVLGLPLYWTMKYQIDYTDVFNKFFSGGYMKYADVTVSLSRWTIPELKDILKQNNLPTTGNKKVLVDRILSEIEKEILLREHPSRHFAVTEKGEKLLKQAEFLHYFHSHPNLDISIDKAQSAKDENPDWDKYQVALYLLDKQLHTNRTNKDWGLYRNTLLGISNVYGHYEDLEKQLEYLCLNFFLDLSGLENEDYIDEKYNLSLNPGIITQMFDTQEKLGMSLEQFKQFYLDAVSKTNLPHTYYSPIETWDMILGKHTEVTQEYDMSTST